MKESAGTENSPGANSILIFDILILTLYNVRNLYKMCDKGVYLTKLCSDYGVSSAKLQFWAACVKI